MTHSKKKTLSVIFFTVFLDLLGVGLIIPVLAPILIDNQSGIFSTETDFTTKTIIFGIILSLYSFAQFFSNPVFGALSDRYGRRKILLYSLVGTIVGYSILALGIEMSSLTLVILGRILPGFASGNLTIAYSSLADVSNEQTKTKNFGLIGMAFGLGFVIGPFLGGKLADSGFVSWFNFTTPFLAAVLLAIINLILAYKLFPETLQESKKSIISLFEGINNIKKAFTYKSLRNLFAIVFINNFGFAFFTQFFIIILLEKFGFMQDGIGIVYGYLGIWVAISQGIILRPLANRYTAAKLALYTLPLTTISLIVLLLPDSAIYLFVIIPFIAFSQSTSTSSIQAMISNIADENKQGEILGISSSMNALSQAFPALIGGGVAAADLSYPIILAAISAFVAWLMLVNLYVRKSIIRTQEVGKIS